MYRLKRFKNDLIPTDSHSVSKEAVFAGPPQSHGEISTGQPAIDADQPAARAGQPRGSAAITRD